MSQIAELLVKIGADNSGLKKGLSESQSSIKEAFSTDPVTGFTSALTGTVSGVESLIGKFSGLAAVTAGGFGFAALIEKAVDAGNAVYEMSQRLGVSATEAVTLSRVLSLSGSDVGTFNSAMMRLDKSFTATGTSGKLCRDTLKATGVALTDANGKLLPVTDQLTNLAAGYDKAKQSGQQQAFLMNTLGVKGLQLTKVFEDYNEKMKIASGIKGVGLNPEEMHKLSLEIDAVKMQAGQLGIVFGSALAPIAAEVFPPILTGLQTVATYLGKNKAGVVATTEEVLKLYAAYKLVNMGKSALTTVKNVTQGLVSNSGEKASASELSAFQEKMIDKSVTASERGYMRKINAAIKSAQAESVSADEAAVKIAIAIEKIASESEAASMVIREKMTATFTSITATAEESAIAINTAIASTGMAATEAAGVKTATTVESADACTAVVIESSAAQVDAIAATGEAAEEAAAVKTAVTEESADACTAATEISSIAQAESMGAVGIAAEIAGEKAVAANSSAVIAANELTLAETGVAEAEIIAGDTAVEAGAKTEISCAAATTGVELLSGAVALLQQNWLLVAYATYEALSWLVKYQNQKDAIDSYNKKATVHEGKDQYGNVYHTKDTTVPVMVDDKRGGQMQTGTRTERVPLSDAEEEELEGYQYKKDHPQEIPKFSGLGALPTAQDYAKPPATHKAKTGKTDAEKAAEAAQKALEKEQKKANEVNDKILKSYQDLFFSKAQVAEAGYAKERAELEKTKDVNTAYYDTKDENGNVTQLGAKSQLDAILTEKKRVAAEEQLAIEQGYTDKAIALAQELSDIQANAIGGSVAAQNAQNEADKTSLKAITDKITGIRKEINETTNLQDRLDKITAGKKAGVITGDTSSGIVTKKNTQPFENAELAGQEAINKQSDQDKAYANWKADLDKEYNAGHIEKYKAMLDQQKNLDENYKNSQQSYMTELDTLWKKTNTNIYDYTTELLQTMDTSLESSLSKFMTGAETINGVIKDLSKSVLNDMVKTASQKSAATLTSSLTSGLTSLLGSSTKKSNSTISSNPMAGLDLNSLIGSIKFAAGGFVSGAGTGTSDSIHAMLSDGEYVMTAKATKALGVGNLNNLNKYASGGLVTRSLRGYASGGLVTGSPLSSLGTPSSATTPAVKNVIQPQSTFIFNNNTGQPVKAEKTDTKIDSRGMQTQVFNLLFDSVDRNVGGSRDALKGALGIT